MLYQQTASHVSRQSSDYFLNRRMRIRVLSNTLLDSCDHLFFILGQVFAIVTVEVLPLHLEEKGLDFLVELQELGEKDFAVGFPFKDLFDDEVVPAHEGLDRAGSVLEGQRANQDLFDAAEQSVQGLDRELLLLEASRVKPQRPRETVGPQLADVARVLALGGEGLARVDHGPNLLDIIDEAGHSHQLLQQVLLDDLEVHVELGIAVHDAHVALAEEQRLKSLQIQLYELFLHGKGVERHTLEDFHLLERLGSGYCPSEQT